MSRDELEPRVARDEDPARPTTGDSPLPAASTRDGAQHPVRRLHRGPRRSLIWYVAAVLVVALAVSGVLLLGREASVSRPATHGGSRIANAGPSAAFQSPDARQAVAQTAARTHGTDVQIHHTRTPCLTTTSRRLCAWAAAKHCNRILFHATTKVLKRSPACLRLLRQFNARRTTQYVMTQESHE